MSQLRTVRGSVNRVRVRYELFRERCRSVRRYNTLLSVRASNLRKKVTVSKDLL